MKPGCIFKYQVLVEFAILHVVAVPEHYHGRRRVHTSIHSDSNQAGMVL